MDILTGRPDHIEDALIAIYFGQWFGWSDSSNKVYANLIVHDDSITKPTEAEVNAKLAELQTAWDEANSDIAKLRAERNQRLANTDWWASSDLTMTEAQTAYRQALRDITDTYTSLDDVVWPEVPNE